MDRGILMHISSLPSPYGIGNLGKEAFRFADFLRDSGQTLWQILPLNPTGFGDSPYQSVSAFAGNPYFVDIDTLVAEGLLTLEETENYFFGENPSRVDYERLFFYRFPLLRCAFFRFVSNAEYIRFTEENAFWLDDYALFMAIKEKNHYKSREDWDLPLKNRDGSVLSQCRKDLKQTIDFYKFIQFKFFEQWGKLKKYANDNGIKIIGDMPIYVASDSAEVWAFSELFELDGHKNPESVACCPPDKCFKNGQLWGNPLYNWENMKKDGYLWWRRRLALAQKMYDALRIDHFCGFFEYYSVPSHAKTAEGAVLKKAPGEDFFSCITKDLHIKIIAENLGKYCPRAEESIKKYGFCGMDVLQLLTDFKNESAVFSPKNAAYTGTHDNDTITGWYESLSTRKRRAVRKIFGIKRLDNPTQVLIKSTLTSGAELAVIPIQDYLGMGSTERMNTPSIVGGNWLVRIRKEELTPRLSAYIKSF